VKIVGIIPARFASTRFPGKPLALIAGKPLIQHVVEQCQKAKSLSEIVVATDDTRIWEVTQNFCRVEMTRPEHPSGSDRIAEVAERISCDAIVNIQGDEPLIDSNVIDAVANALAQNEIKIYPSLWWVGMKNPHLQVLIHGKNVGKGKLLFYFLFIIFSNKIS